MPYERDDSYRCQECNHRITASEFFFCTMTCDDCTEEIEQQNQQKASLPVSRATTQRTPKGERTDATQHSIS